MFSAIGLGFRGVRHLRRRAAPGYRFLANVEAGEVALTQAAAEATHADGGLLIVACGYDAHGRRVEGLHAIYVREDLPEPTAFWSYRDFLKTRVAAATWRRPSVSGGTKAESVHAGGQAC